MSISELHQDESLRQREFPVTKRSVFLAHAGVCPLPSRVAGAIQQYAEMSTEADQESLYGYSLLQQTRQLAAELIKAQADEISFVGPTSLALSFIAGGLSWKPGDNAILYFEDYPSNVYPWALLEGKGVEIRRIQPRAYGQIELSDIEPLADRRTRLAALASCHFIAGDRLDVATIGRFLRDKKILFCLDAIQTLGAFPTTVEHVDFLAADAHKWLLGPCAAGILYVRRDLQEQLRPIVAGWNNLPCPSFVAQEQPGYRSGPRRYEAGTYNFLGLAGLHAALELIQEIGIDEISKDLLRKRAWLVERLEDAGWPVLHAPAPEDRASAIVSFFRPGTNMQAVQSRLEAANIVASLRSNRAGNRYVRLSPHFYNTTAELDRCLEVVEGTANAQ